MEIKRRRRRRGLLGWIDRNLIRVESWWSLGALIAGSGAMTWLWNKFADFGWAGSILIGIASSCAVIVAVSIALVAWRYFHPLPKPTVSVPVPLPPTAPTQEVADATLAPSPGALGLLGGAIGGAPIGSLEDFIPSPAPPRVDPNTEHEDKRKAKEALVPLARDYFRPAEEALRKFKLAAKDQFLFEFSRKGAARAVCSRAIDHAPEKPSTRKDYVAAHELTSIEKVRGLNLYEAETSFYHAYIDYGATAVLAVDLVNECAPRHESVIDSLKTLYADWLSAHETFVARQLALRERHLDLNTVGILHTLVLKELPEPNWARATAKPK